MEIFLLLVVILLLIIFNSSKNSKLKKTEERLSNIENYLKKVSFSQAQKTTATTTPSIIPPVKPFIVPKIIVEQPLVMANKKED